MRKFFWIFMAIMLTGCVTVKIPKYLQDKFPYQKTYYSPYEETLTAVRQALADSGWKVSEVSSPMAFEQGEVQKEAEGKQVLIFTEVRQTPLFLSSRYLNLNAYVRASDDGTDVEIRYLGITPMLFKHSQNYRNDAVVNKIFDRISELLNQ